MDITNEKYTVWVGGTEVTDNYVEFLKAIDILKLYQEKGYTHVIVQAKKNGERKFIIKENK